MAEYLDKPPRASSTRVFRVSEINRSVRFLLEDGFSDLWVEGELSDVRRATTGHVYFVLNDERESAQIRGVMFRGDAVRSRARLAPGARVKMRGGLSLFEPRGQFQLLARIALPAGAGDLAAEFERVRKVLAAEGLLDAERKRALPLFPRVVGVVTSKESAALADIVRVASHRAPVRLVVADARVQGEPAPASIARAIAAIQRLPQLDVLIVARGGGSAEELWAFNAERVARAIAACRVPVVSGVGHEVDVTIADLVADVRAATPSNAAELVVPEHRVLIRQRAELARRAIRAIEVRFDRARLQLERIQRRLADPRSHVARVRARLTELHRNLQRNQDRHLRVRRARLEALEKRLRQCDPRATLAHHRTRLQVASTRLAGLSNVTAQKRNRVHEIRARLTSASPQHIRTLRGALARLHANLHALSPLAVLQRGYAIALHEGKAVRKAEEVPSGARLTIRVAEGEIAAKALNTESSRKRALR